MPPPPATPASLPCSLIILRCTVLHAALHRIRVAGRAGIAMLHSIAACKNHFPLCATSDKRPLGATAEQKRCSVLRLCATQICPRIRFDALNRAAPLPLYHLDAPRCTSNAGPDLPLQVTCRTRRDLACLLCGPPCQGHSRHLSEQPVKCDHDERECVRSEKQALSRNSPSAVQ